MEYGLNFSCSKGAPEQLLKFSSESHHLYLYSFILLQYCVYQCSHIILSKEVTIDHYFTEEEWKLAVSLCTVFQAWT